MSYQPWCLAPYIDHSGAAGDEQQHQTYHPYYGLVKAAIDDGLSLNDLLKSIRYGRRRCGSREQTAIWTEYRRQMHVKQMETPEGRKAYEEEVRVYREQEQAAIESQRRISERFLRYIRESIGRLHLRDFILRQVAKVQGTAAEREAAALADSQLPKLICWHPAQLP
jgi:hypothetical protein